MSRIVFFFGSSRSRRRSATVTSSHPDASRAASIASSVVYLPVPRNSRERIATPATTRGSACVSVCTGQSLRKVVRHPLPLGERAGGEGSELLQLLLQKKRPVAGIRQALHRILDLEPLELVDLDPGLEPPAARLHHPVARDLVPTAPVHIRGAAQWAHQLAAKPGLLAHLAQRAVLGRLVRLDLALGQCPVVVGGAVDDRDLGVA